MFKAIRHALFGPQKKKESKSLAKSRLHFVLVQDRAGLSGDEMSAFKSELMTVVEKYFVVDKRGFDISYQREGDSTTLLINSPVIVRRAMNSAEDDVAEAANSKPSYSSNNNQRRKKKRRHGQMGSQTVAP